MAEILVVGSVGYDTIETPSGKVDSVVGGSANYFSLAASLYSPVNVVGVVGRDYRDEDLQILQSRKVNLSGLKVEDGKTFRWSGSYLEDLNEAVTLKTELNVFRDFDPKLLEKHKQSDYVFLANIDPTLQMSVLQQVNSPKVIGLDTMNYWINSKKNELNAVLKKVDIFLLNESEALKLAEENNIVVAVKKLSEIGPDCVVVKRGEYGFFMYSHGRYFVLPAYPVAQVVDPTGAGDAFAGGFFGYLSRNGDPKSFRAQQEACVHGAVIASFCVQDFSVRLLTQLDWPKVEKRISEYMQVVSFASPKS
ncbi:MAG: sugar kinase [Bdellovibrionales bacterium RBG_16_40_8]|nr:MAG: sugar kinase [Bdellovibrionales bacterium RBG_16_40_8]